MASLRTISTRRLVCLGTAVAVAAACGAALAVTASGSGGAVPPAKPLADAIHDSLAGGEIESVSARVTFTNKLFPSGALLGNAAPAFVSGGSGRLWMTADGRGRLELQSDAGDAQITWRPGALSVYDASSNTVYRAALPTSAAPGSRTADAAPTPTQIADALARLGSEAALSAAVPTNVGGLPAYALLLTPKRDGGLLGAVEVSWDAAHAVPLRLAVYARGSSSPVLALTTDEVSYGPVADDVVDVAPPSDAQVVDIGHPTAAPGPPSGVAGLDAVRAAAGFPVTAPDTLAGLPRRDVRLVGGSDTPAALAVYGEGPGAVVVLQRPTPASGGTGSGSGPLGNLPSVSIGGHSAHELTTPLGTIVTWQSGGVTTVVGGSVSAAVAERAAQELA